MLKLIPPTGKLAVFAASLLALFSLVGLVAPSAQAAPAASASVQTAPTSATTVTYPSIPADMNGDKYFISSICVGSTLRSDLYPVAAIAQQWNAAVNNPTNTTLRLDASTNCTADGYTARQTMTIGVFNNPNYGACLAFTNLADFPFGEGSNMSYWQHGPGVYLNVGIPGCVSTAQRRSHQIAAGIGYALGLEIMTTSGYASRVMCTCSIDTIRSPDSTSAHRVWQIYNGVYGG